MDVVENYMVTDSVMYTPIEERQQRRDNVRSEILRYNEDSTSSYDQDNDDTPFIPDSYIEPTSDGYPGLEAPLA